MERILKITGDGSPTIYLPELDEHYHSIHGAVQEARHVFIQNGLHEFKNREEINILEIGFGTGLNALLTCIESASFEKSTIHYTGIESHPIPIEEWTKIDFTNQVNSDLYVGINTTIINSTWEITNEITCNFMLEKKHIKLQEFKGLPNHFDLIYYDAFGPRAQAEMWKIECFIPLYNFLKSGGLLVTYCAQGQFKRNLKQVGFQIESRQGPPGKREMTLAWKKF